MKNLKNILKAIHTELKALVKKIENLLGVLDIDLTKAEDKTTFDSLFDFG